MYNDFFKNILICLSIALFFYCSSSHAYLGENLQMHFSDIDGMLDATEELQTWLRQDKARELSQRAAEQKDRLLLSADSPAFHHDGSISVILFSGYDCRYCIKSRLMLQDFVEHYPEVQVIFKDWPLLDPDPQTSEIFAKRGVAIWKMQGGDGYLRYLEKYENNQGGEIVKNELLPKIVPANISKKADVEMASTMTLADSIGIMAVPTFIIMPTEKPTRETTIVLPGLPEKEVLLRAVDRVNRGIDIG